ncbi:hypothetical protein HYT02_01415 [Candidatus Gottesmanbacteria bacterium]|nr:hypothetical protein [Candidatus Gottesmanbacteria bacterium]
MKLIRTVFDIEKNRKKKYISRQQTKRIKFVDKAIDERLDNLTRDDYYDQE